MKAATWIGAVGALLFLASAARADVPSPDGRRHPRPDPFARPSHAPNAVSFALEPTDDAEPRLIVPLSLLGRGKNVARLDNREAPQGPLFAGVALGGLLVGGFALTGRRRASRGALLALLLAGALFTAHGDTQARTARPPVNWIAIEGLRLQAVRVEIAKEGDRVRLLVPRNRFAGIAASLKAR